MALHVLVLAGGSGTRLWPLSRGGTPKHLLPLGPGGVTLLRATLERVAGIGEEVHVVTAAAQAEQCAAELAAAGLDPAAVIAEPEARGTGPALSLATALLAERDPDALILSVHADARVGDTPAYRAAVVASAGWAKATGGVATVGLTPAYPSTGMGYIEKGVAEDAARWQAPADLEPSLVSSAAALPAFGGAGFLEKPSQTVAEQYVAGGGHLWNLGLFAWPAAALLEQLRERDPAMHETIHAVVAARLAHDEHGAATGYASLRGVPVEPLLIEQWQPLTVVEAEFPWSDVGSWQDLYEARLEEGTADSHANVVEGETVLVDATGNAVIARGGRVVALVGVEDLVVVDTPDAVLVVPRSLSQRVREVVEALRRAESG